MANPSDSARKRLTCSYGRWKPEGDFDTIVIGSGIGGLTAAVLLAREGGQRVAVLERHYTAGGYTHSFRRPGFEWDVGVHYVGEVGSADLEPRAAFDYLSCGELQWAPMGDVYDRMVFPHFTFDYTAGRDRLIQNLIDHFPNERDRIWKYFQIRNLFHM